MIAVPSRTQKGLPAEESYDCFHREPLSVHRMSIFGFSTYYDKPVGEEIRSAVFSIDKEKFKMTDFKTEVKWQIGVYPNGHDDRHEGNVTFLLRSLNEFDVKIGCEFIVSTNIYKKATYKSCKFQHTFESNASLLIDCTITDRNEFLDLLQVNKDLCTVPPLERGSDDLTIDWKIFFVNKPVVNSCHLNLLKNVGSLLETGEHFDVTLVSSDGIEHKAHKLILHCRSNVFSALIRDNTTESQADVVKIEDVDSQTLKQMLQFLYTGEVESMEDNAKNLFLAADKYLLDDLKDLCLKFLCNNINNDNVLDLIDFALTHDIWKLRLETKLYFLKNSPEVIEMKGLDYIKNLPRDFADKLLIDLAMTRDIGAYVRVRTLSDGNDLYQNIFNQDKEIVK